MKDLLVAVHLEAAVYLFKQRFDLRLDIGAAKNKGVTFMVVYKKRLDVEIFKLTGRKDSVLNTTEEGPVILVSITTSTINNKASSAVTLEVKAGLSIFDYEPLPTKTGYKSGYRSFFINSALPTKFLSGSEAHSVVFRYKNWKWSFRGQNVNNESVDKISDAKPLI